LLQEAARRGEFGCVVETSLSKMVQSGVEHCKVADAMQWLQIGECVGGGGGTRALRPKGNEELADAMCVCVCAPYSA
jgi:hypothetical protein